MMAIPTYVGASVTWAESTGAGTPDMPVGATTADLLICHIEGEGEDANADNMTDTGAWTLIGTVANDTAGSAWDTRHTLWWAPYSAGINREAADAGNHVLAGITAWRGVDLTTPIHKQQSSSDDAANTAVSITGVTTTLDDCLIVCSHSAGDNNQVTSPVNANLSDLTLRLTHLTAQGSDGMIAVISGGLASLGASGTTTATQAATEREANWCIALAPASGVQALTGVLFTKAPTFPTGIVAAGTVALTGTTFAKAPTFPTGTVAATYALTGNVYQQAPTFPVGAMGLGAVALTGTVYQQAPTFPTGLVVGGQALVGTVYQLAPTFPTGVMGLGVVALTGTVYQQAPTFPTGVVVAGVVAVTGIVYQLAPTFPTGTMGLGAVALTGTTFTKAPTFPTGIVATGVVALTSAGTYTVAPTFPVGVVVGGQALTGIVYQQAPSFFVGIITGGAVAAATNRMGGTGAIRRSPRARRRRASR